MTAPLINVGASKDAIREARAAINDILNSKASDKTKSEALRALSTLCNVNGTSISDCNFTGVGK